jgi:hypothetical protein
MIPNMPAQGIRFDIGKIESGAYGIECWKVFWRAVSIERLSGTLLFEGDTTATLNGRENVYCIAVQSINTTIFDEIRVALEQSTEFKRIAASPRFVESNYVVGEPLFDAGQVDSAGNLVGKAFNSRPALGVVLRERQQLSQAGQPSIAVSERKKPASSRTANLPAISSLKDLLDFLLANFGEKNKWQFWVTPEELCDIVEQYADILQVQWYEGSCGLSVDMTYVTLFNKGKAGENIALHGLFPFATTEAAKQFCYDKDNNFEYLFGQLEGFYGIQGQFATNFSGKKHSNWVNDKYYKKERDIGAFDLWPRICRRRESLGISLSSEPNKPAKLASTIEEQSATRKPDTTLPTTKLVGKKKWWEFWK